MKTTQKLRYTKSEGKKIHTHHSIVIVVGVVVWKSLCGKFISFCRIQFKIKQKYTIRLTWWVEHWLEWSERRNGRTKANQKQRNVYMKHGKRLKIISKMYWYLMTWVWLCDGMRWHTRTTQHTHMHWPCEGCDLCLDQSHFNHHWSIPCFQLLWRCSHQSCNPHVSLELQIIRRSKH